MISLRTFQKKHCLTGGGGEGGGGGRGGGGGGGISLPLLLYAEETSNEIICFSLFFSTRKKKIKFFSWLVFLPFEDDDDKILQTIFRPRLERGGSSVTSER